MARCVVEGNKLSTPISLATQQEQRIQALSILFVRKLLEGYTHLAGKYPFLQPEIMAVLDEVEV